MTPQRYRRLCELFEQAEALAPAERAAFVERARGGDPSLGAELEKLLAHDAAARRQRLFEDPCPVNARDLLSAGGPAATLVTSPDGSRAASSAGDPADPLLGQRVGPYLIQQRVGHGGMGSVYLATREDAYRQQVAVKVIQPGLGGAELVSRFQTERQVLAELPHPHIARLLDGGNTADGRPYFVMEYIDGEPLDRYCDRRQLGTAERLRLLQAVCRAVQHAHERQVLHRDLKPGNVLVTADGTVKVTDFGLAKRMQGGEALTATGAVLGTPSYMAPEQAGGLTRQLGPEADVYGLGAILYELLTGRPPFRGETPVETLLQVLTEEPVPPARLHPGLPRDLETVCLKCLRKERRKRYASAAALADELGRFLRGEPTLARPVGRAARLWRWCRRKPALATASGLALVAGAATLVVSVLFGAREHQAAERTRQEQARTADALEGSRRLSAALALDQGLGLCESGEVGRGMLWLVHSLELAPEGAADLRRAIRTNLGGWRARLRAQRHPFAGPDLVWRLGFHPDGRLALTAFLDGTARLWDAATGAPVGEVMRHDKAALAFAFSPDRALLATGAADRKARLWGAADGRAVGKPLGHPDDVTALTFSPDGRTLLTGCADGVCRFWDVATGRLLGGPLRHAKEVTALAFSPDGKSVLTASADHTARLWHAGSHAPAGEVMRHAGPVGAALFSPDGKVIVTASGGDTARCWDAATGTPRGEPMRHGARPADAPPRVSLAVAVSPDGTTVLTGGDDGTARLWDAARGVPLTDPLRHPDWVAAVAFSPDGRSALTACSDGNARLWDAVTGQALGPPFPHGGGVEHLAFSPDGTAVLVGGYERTARLWEAALPGLARPPLTHRDAAMAGAFHPHNPLVVTADKRGTAQLWDADTGRAVGAPLAHPSMVRDLTFSPDGKVLVVGTGDGGVWFWDLATRKPVFDPPPRHNSLVWSVAFSPDGRSVLTGSQDGTARLWDVATGRQRAKLAHEGPVDTVAYGPDNRVVATGSYDGTARLWDADTGKPLASVSHGGWVWAVAFHPAGRLLATAGSDGTARLWDLAGRAHGRALGHANRVRCLAFSPDGRLLLTGSEDRTARLWDVATGEPAGPPLTHAGRLTSLAFGPDGRTVLTGCHDGTARLWDVAAGKPLGPPLRHRKDVQAVAYRSDGRRVLTVSMDGTARLWEVPGELGGDAERLRLWVQVTSGQELAGDGSVRWLEATELRERRQRLQERGGPP